MKPPEPRDPAVVARPPDPPPEDDREARILAVLAAYLHAVDSGCGPDRDLWLEAHPDLADELAAFIDQEDRLQRMIGTSHRGDAADPLPAMAMPDEEGIDFGDYVLLEAIARGGMGIVYRARHKSLGRLVALKMILGGELATEDDRRRFQHEAGAIAQLDHPHIVPIYDVGEHRGHCYYAMKLMENGGLDRRIGGSPTDPRLAARLMVDIARAVHHAHQRGILHRDLKPSNILIDADGRPHVADFGLAKRLGLEGSDSTRTGLVLGTPSFMAPEQASARRDAVTTATDVYGLGAVLYALLSGRPPFRGESVLETIELVRLREPDPPSSPGSGVDRDLQTICLTCLRKEPARRYPTAAAMADDLERWLAGEPIAARPMRGAERLGRWIRREPLSAALAAVLVLFVAAGVAGLAVSNLLIARERDAARAQRQIALEQSRLAAAQRRRADDRFRQAHRAVDEMYTQVAERWLYDQPKLTGIQRDFLEKALTFYEGLSREDADDPSIQVDRARALGRLAWIRLRLGRPESSEAALYQPVEILRSLADRSPERIDYLEALGDAYSGLGAQLSEQRRWAEANRAVEGAVGVHRELVRRRPDEAGYRRSMALGQAKLGVLYQSIGRAAEAQRLGFAGVATLDELRRALPNRADPHDDGARMMVLEELGCVLVDNRRLAEAEAVLRESLAIGGRLPAGTIARQDLLHRSGHTNMYLGDTLERIGRVGEAEAAFGRALALFERLARDYPDLAPYRLDAVEAQLGRAIALADRGRLREARDLARRQVARSEQLVATYPELVNGRRTLLTSLLRLGRLLDEGGSAADREQSYRRAIEVGERLAAVDPAGVHPRYHLAVARLELASLLGGRGRPSEARGLVDRSITTLERLARDGDGAPAFRQTLAMAHAANGELLLADGRPAEARRALRRAAVLFDEDAARLDGDPEFTAHLARFLSCCPLTELRDPSRAADAARRATRRFPRRGDLWSVLALSCYRDGDGRGAIAAAEEAIRLRDGAGVSDRLVLALAYQRDGDDERGRQCYRAASASIPAGSAIPSYLRGLRDEAEGRLGGPDGARRAALDRPAARPAPARP